MLEGCWHSQDGSRYWVSRDGEDAPTLSVRTQRPGGRTLTTRALIRARVTKDGESKVCWSQSFVLRARLESPDRVRWSSTRAGKDFVWSRADQVEKDKDEEEEEDEDEDEDEEVDAEDRVDGGWKGSHGGG